MSLAKKLFLLFLVPVAIGLAVFSFVSIYYERKDIYHWEIEKNRLISLAVATAIRKEMLHKEADRVRELIGSLKRSGRYEELRVLRINGEEAFLDLKTLKEVTEQRGKGEEGWAEGHLNLGKVPRVDRPEFIRVLKTGREITFFERKGEKVILTTFTPIFNEPVCQECHGRSSPIRGILQVSTDLRPAQAFIGRSIKRNLLISLAILLILASLGIFLTQQTISPLKRLQRGISLIREGGIPADLDIHTGDEIQELGEEVRNMSLTLQKQRQRIQALLEASHAISANLQLEEVLQLIVERAYSLVEARAGALTYRSDMAAGGTGFIFRTAGLNYGDCQVKETPSFTRLNGAVMRLGRPLRLDDYLQHPEARPLPGGHIPIGPFLGVPIIIQGQSVGQVYTIRGPGEPPFTAQDEEILTSFANQAAIAIQNARNYQEIEKKAERFRLLEKMGDTMLSSMDLPSILKGGLNMIMEMAGIRQGAVLLRAGYDTKWRVCYHQGLPEEVLSSLERSLLEEGLEGMAILQGKIQISSPPQPIKPGLDACMGIPLRGKSGVIGVINLYAASTESFTKVDMDSLQVAADQMAMGIENTRLYLEAKERLEQASIFRDFAEVAMMISTEEEIVSAAAKAAERLFPCDYGVIYLYDPAIDTLYPVATWGAEAAGPADTPSYEEAAKRCLALRRGKAFSVKDQSKGVACSYKIKLLRGEPRSYLCVPMIALGDIIGVVHIVWQQPYAFTTNQEITLGQFADMIALSLGNLRHLQLAERQAMTDGLTGLYNFRFFQDHLNKELARAKRKGEKLSIVMVDIDYFKEFNDRYGHDMGDQILKTLGLTLPKLLRSADLAARYGGEEFVILLPDTDTEGARQVGEKLRRTLSEIKIRGDRGIQLSITVSIGIATFPDHGSSPSEVIKAADIALYNSKSKGRNCVSIYGQ